MTVPAVRIPATSANLGPGFDAFGAALDLYLTVKVAAREGDRVTTAGEGADELPRDDRNLIWRAARALAARRGATLPDVSLHVHNEIPLERGLGSSAAAAVAGAAIARALLALPVSDDEVVGVAAGLEGHPDNAAAAVFGGVVVCVGALTRRFDPTPSLRPVVCIPTARQATTLARALLPDTVPLADAAASVGRAALVLAGLVGLTAFEPVAMTDVLHEPPRLAAMPGSGRLIAALRHAGIAACLSGAGPTVLAVVPADDDAAVTAVQSAAGPGWVVRPSAWHREGLAATP